MIVAALALLGPATASAQEAGVSLELSGVPTTLTIPGSFTMTVSGSTGATSDAVIYSIYGPAPCAASVEAQLEADPDEVLLSAEPDERPAFGFTGVFTVETQGVGQGVSGPGLYRVCVFMEASEESETGEPAEEEERLVAVASGSFAAVAGSTSPVPVIGAGGAECFVPHTRGKRLRSAERALGRAHCAVGLVKKSSSRRFKRGRVISQNPRAGSSLGAGAKVNLLVSAGPPDAPAPASSSRRRRPRARSSRTPTDEREVARSTLSLTWRGAVSTVVDLQLPPT